MDNASDTGDKSLPSVPDNDSSESENEGGGGGGSNTGGVKPGKANKPGGVYTVAEEGGEETDLTANVVNILNGVVGVLGLVCVVVMIIGGVNYITSAGDSSKVEKGKKTILYGLIGLVICVLAFAVVNFVIRNIIGGGSGE